MGPLREDALKADLAVGYEEHALAVVSQGDAVADALKVVLVVLKVVLSIYKKKS